MRLPRRTRRRSHARPPNTHAKAAAATAVLSAIDLLDRPVVAPDSEFPAAARALRLCRAGA